MGTRMPLAPTYPNELVSKPHNPTQNQRRSPTINPENDKNQKQARGYNPNNGIDKEWYVRNYTLAKPDFTLCPQF